MAATKFTAIYVNNEGKIIEREIPGMNTYIIATKFAIILNEPEETKLVCVIETWKLYPIENNKNGVPEKSLWMQGIWASLLALSGQYGDLLDMISFVIVLFYMITVFGVIYMRIKKPDAERSYKTWLYPATPIVTGKQIGRAHG